MNTHITDENGNNGKIIGNNDIKIKNVPKINLKKEGILI
jgi:hypothetical protein